MHKTKLHALLFSLSMAVFPAYAANSGFTATFTDLGKLGGYSSRATAINDLNEVVGYSDVGRHFEVVPVLWSGGKTIRLETFGGSYNVAEGINNAGQIVGVTNVDGIYRATTWRRDGKASDLGFISEGKPHLSQSSALGINAAGQIVGYSTTDDMSASGAARWINGTGSAVPGVSFTSGYRNESYAMDINNRGDIAGYGVPTGSSNPNKRAFLWTEEAGVIDLGTLGGNTSHAYAVNENRQVVGESYINAGWDKHAVTWVDGKAIDLGTLGGSSSAALDINNRGQIVGWSQGADNGQNRAVLWSDGVAIDLNSLLGVPSGYRLLEATGINNLGTIVGFANVGFETHAFMMTVSPVPEPETYGMVLGSLALFGVLRKRMKQQASA